MTHRARKPRRGYLATLRALHAPTVDDVRKLDEAWRKDNPRAAAKFDAEKARQLDLLRNRKP